MSNRFRVRPAFDLNESNAYRQQLEDEFFEFADGSYDRVKAINIADIDDLDRPDAERLGKAMFRLEWLWKMFCKAHNMPGETQGFLRLKIKRRWMELEKSGLQKRHRRG